MVSAIKNKQPHEQQQQQQQQLPQPQSYSIALQPVANQIDNNDHRVNTQISTTKSPIVTSSVPIIARVSRENELKDGTGVRTNGLRMKRS